MSSKFIYETEAFIPKFNGDLIDLAHEIFWLSNEIIVNNRFYNNKTHIESYKKQHFVNLEDEKTKIKIEKFEFYFLNKVI